LLGSVITAAGSHPMRKMPHPMAGTIWAC
jgi:hypothetical protein